MDKGEQTYETDICGSAGAEPASARGLLEGRFAHGAVPDRACHAGSDRTGDRGPNGAADWTVCTPDGTELAVRKGVSAYPQTIEPGEKGWYYDEFTVDTAQTGELAVQYDGDALAASIRAAEQNGVRYAVSDVNLKDSVYGGVELTGRIRNDTAERGRLVCVAAVLLDESEKPLGVVYAVLDSPLEAGAETTFGISSEMLPPEVKSADIAQVETFAYPLAE